VTLTYTTLRQGESQLACKKFLASWFISLISMSDKSS